VNEEENWNNEEEEKWEEVVFLFDFYFISFIHSFVIFSFFFFSISVVWMDYGLPMALSHLEVAFEMAFLKKLEFVEIRNNY
jgi:hypothetical protein